MGGCVLERIPSRWSYTVCSHFQQTPHTHNTPWNKKHTNLLLFKFPFHLHIMVCEECMGAELWGKSWDADALERGNVWCTELTQDPSDCFSGFMYPSWTLYRCDIVSLVEDGRHLVEESLAAQWGRPWLWTLTMHRAPPPPPFPFFPPQMNNQNHNIF